ncbi:hypothetical protein [Agrococcus jejuensis]|uniref:Uncharacterized protein n=1 Tax=Agrococcus jejuensis TaxID=399736 RepID=A0A1G8C389_9MICO|nr:hypothetical protein [Agrococcus jejuensis]SDH39758.1 hypothetical protein SAMN04489720_1147 [Agrococcus jejuensis]
MALFDPADARALTERERSTLHAAITQGSSIGYHGRPGPEITPAMRRGWLSRLDVLQAVSNCACGCASVSLLPSDATAGVPGEDRDLDAMSGSVHLHVRIVDGVPFWIEVTENDAKPALPELPPVDEWTWLR